MLFRQFVFMLGLITAFGNANAKVPAEQMARLGADLTPLGSERDGNKDGTIPA